MNRFLPLILLGLACTAPARGESLRDLCADAPGLGTPSCTLDKDHAAIEFGAIDWTRDQDAGRREDMLLTGDMLFRYGVTGSLEAQVGWTAYGHLRERGADGAVRRADGTGDVRIALRKNLANPDGSGFSIAVMPSVSLPTGGSAIGVGDWSASLLVPVSYELGDALSLGFTGEIDGAADEDGGGHHLAFSGIVGLGASLTGALSAAAELAAARDEEQETTEWLAGLSLAMMRGESLQFGAGANIGLNHEAADLQLYLNVAKRF